MVGKFLGRSPCYEHAFKQVSQVLESFSLQLSISEKMKNAFTAEISLPMFVQFLSSRLVSLIRGSPSSCLTSRSVLGGIAFHNLLHNSQRNYKDF